MEKKCMLNVFTLVKKSIIIVTEDRSLIIFFTVLQENLSSGGTNQILHKPGYNR